MDVIKKIKDLTAERGWTEYRLVKESGIAASTISNIFHRNTLPNIYTLETLCDTFGITLSQFFSNDVMLYPSEDQVLSEHQSTGTPPILSEKYARVIRF